MLSDFGKRKMASRGERSASSRNRRLNFAQTALEESALAVIGDEGEGPRVTLRRLVKRPKAAEQIGARGVQQMIVVQVIRGGHGIHCGKPRSRTIRHRDRYSTIQGYDGRWLYSFQCIVEPDDLGPIGVGRMSSLAMHGANRSLQSEWA